MNRRITCWTKLKTKIANRRRFDEKLTSEFNKLSNEHRELSMIIIDLFLQLTLMVNLTLLLTSVTAKKRLAAQLI